MTHEVKVLCAVNPAAGTGIGLRRWPKLAELLGVYGMTYEVLSDSSIPIGDQVRTRLAQTAPGTYKAVVGVGGDGTHSAIINALMRYRQECPSVVLPPYAMVPLGTGNDIAKTFGLEAREDWFDNDLRRAVATILYGADYMMDLGRIGDIWFADAMTIGLDSSILQEHNKQKYEVSRFPFLRRVIKGSPLYFWCAGLRLWTQRSMTGDIWVDGSPWYSGPIINLIINNTRVYGGEFVICPDAYANDGFLEAVVFTDQADYLKKYMLSFRTNPRQVQKMAERLGKISSHARARHIAVRLSRSEAAQYDGEVLPASDRFEVQVEPRVFHIKVPAEPA